MQLDFHLRLQNTKILPSVQRLMYVISISCVQGGPLRRDLKQQLIQKCLKRPRGFLMLNLKAVSDFHKTLYFLGKLTYLGLIFQSQQNVLGKRRSKKNEKSKIKEIFH